MQTSVHWLKNVAFEAKSESGHSVVMDGASVYGGETVDHVPWSSYLWDLVGVLHLTL